MYRAESRRHTAPGIIQIGEIVMSHVTELGAKPESQTVSQIAAAYSRLALTNIEVKRPWNLFIKICSLT